MPPFTRRVLLRRGLAAGAAVALPSTLAGCGNDDAAVFDEAASSQVVVEEPTTAPAVATTESTIPPEPTTPETATPSDSTAGAESTERAESTTDDSTALAEPAPAEAARGTNPIAVEFVYTMGAGGKQLNPYIAVWVESQDGTLLRTLGVWYEQTRKGPRWLSDLTQWWRRDQDRINGGGVDDVSVLSSATRTPGTYSFVWDGLDTAGAMVADPQVVVCIESARERGPHSLICSEIEPATVSAPIVLADDGELSGARIVRA